MKHCVLVFPVAALFVGDWKAMQLVHNTSLCAILHSWHRQQWEGNKVTTVPIVLSTASVTIQTNWKAQDSVWDQSGGWQTTEMEEEK